jgi:hypothetical protein
MSRMAHRSGLLGRCSRRGFGVCLLTAMAVALLAAPALASNACEWQSRQQSSTGPEAIRMQSDVGWSTTSMIESTLGLQFGGLWYEHGQTLSVGVTSGPMTLRQEEEAVYAVIEAHVGADELAFVKANTEVMSVPYSPVELKVAQAAVVQELWTALPTAGYIIGQGIGEAPTYWPQVELELGNTVSEAECEAVVLPLLAPYGTKVSLTHVDESTTAIPELGPGQSAPQPLPGVTSPQPSTVPAPAAAITMRVGVMVSHGTAHLRFAFPQHVSGRIRLSMKLLPAGRALIRTVAVDSADVVTASVRLPRGAARVARKLRVDAAFSEASSAGRPVVSAPVTVDLAHRR